MELEGFYVGFSANDRKCPEVEENYFSIPRPSKTTFTANSQYSRKSFQNSQKLRKPRNVSERQTPTSNLLEHFNARDGTFILSSSKSDKPITFKTLSEFGEASF